MALELDGGYTGAHGRYATATTRQTRPVSDLQHARYSSSNVTTRSNRHLHTENGYKPFAIRLPFLVAFLSIFGLCIGLIEQLLATTTSTQERAGISQSTTASHASVFKRADSTCTNEDDLLSQSKTLAASYADLCSEYSEVFAPSSTSLPASLQTSFSSWSLDRNSVMTAQDEVALAMADCATTTADTSTFWLTAGCSSSLFTSNDKGCHYDATFYLSETSIYSGFVVYCAATQSDQLAVATPTTKPPEPASSSEQTIAATPDTVETTLTMPSSSVSITITESASRTISPTTIQSDIGTDVTIVATSSYTSVVEHTTTVESIESGVTTNIRTVMTETTVVAVTPSMHTTTTHYTTMVQSIAGDVTTTFPAVVVETVVEPVTPSSTISESAKPTSTNDVNFTLSTHEAMVDQPFTYLSYFAALYLAPLVAVVIKAIYEIIFSSLRLVEPFERLSQPTGSPAIFSVMAFYLSSSISSDIIRSISNGQFLPLWAAAMYILVEIGAPLSSASMSVKAQSMCLVDDVEMRCDPAWVINTNVIRALQGLLAFGVILVCFLIYSTWDYTLKHVFSNPSSIISLATLLNHEPLLHDLLEIDPDADETRFTMALQDHHFWIDSHQSAITGREQHGLTNQKGQAGRYGTNGYRRHGAGYTPVMNPAISHASSMSRKSRNRLTDGISVLTCLTLLVLLIAYINDYRTDSFNNFFNSQGILPKLIFVGLATLVDTQIKHLERVIRITEPYRRLNLRYARPETTILLPLNGTCWSNLSRCIYSVARYSGGNMGWQTMITIVACLSDFNIIAVAGVLFTDAQTPQSFQVCSYIAIFITSLILIHMLITVGWWRRVRIIKEMPRRPETIGAVLSYLCGSVMVREWMMAVRFEGLSERERNKVVIESGKRFRFAQVVSEVDEKLRWCIDFERDGMSKETVGMSGAG